MKASCKKIMNEQMFTSNLIHLMCFFRCFVLRFFFVLLGQFAIGNCLFVALSPLRLIYWRTFETQITQITQIKLKICKIDIFHSDLHIEKCLKLEPKYQAFVVSYLNVKMKNLLTHLTYFYRINFL